MRWILALLVILNTLPACAWYSDTSFRYRQKITVLDTKVPGDLTDFPVYLNTDNLSSGFYTHAQSDCGDVRITKADGSTEVPRQIVFCTGTNGEIHFEASGTLSGSSDTDFYIYYGNATVADYAVNATYGSDNVWDSNYKGVWHLQEAVNTSAGGYVDSTANNHDGTGVSMALTEVDGKLSGKAQDFDGSADYINLTSFDIGQTFSVSLWINRDVEAGTIILADRGLVAGDQFNYLFGGAGGVDATQVYVQNTGVASTANTMSTGTWYLLGFTFDASANSVKYYFNGTNYDSDTQTANPSHDASYPFSLMTQLIAGVANSPTNGKADEVRISNSIRTDNWMTTEYNNQSSPSTFYTIGAEEEVPSDEEPILFLWDFI